MLCMALRHRSINSLITSINKEILSMLQVAIVAIGATMVGSITFVKKEGDFVKRGEEVSTPYIYMLLMFVVSHNAIPFNKQFTHLICSLDISHSGGAQ